MTRTGRTITRKAPLLLAAPCIAALAACGSGSPVPQGPSASSNRASAEYSRCKEEAQDGDATTCWSRFIKRFGELASQSERDFAQAYIDAHRHTNNAQENREMSQAARQTAPSESIDPTPENVASGGGQTQQTSAQGYPPQRVGYSDCYANLTIPEDGSDALAKLTDACGAPTGMIPVSSVHNKTQASADDPDVFTLQLDANSCYRLFAVGDTGIQAMKAMVTTAAGEILSADVSGDRAPIVGPNRPFCVTQGGDYKYVVAVIKGSGKYFFQMWNAQPPTGGTSS
jgi:hypothetical protein